VLGDVSDPELVRAVAFELTVDEIRGCGHVRNAPKPGAT
jgi:hypothetical protein